MNYEIFKYRQFLFFGPVLYGYKIIKKEEKFFIRLIAKGFKSPDEAEKEMDYAKTFDIFKDGLK